MPCSARCTLGLLLLAQVVLIEAVRVRTAARDLGEAEALTAPDRREAGVPTGQPWLLPKVIQTAEEQAQEMAIYKRHWYPLEPPPSFGCGGPISPAAQAAIHEAQALEPKYTAYWQGLPKLRPSRKLKDVQKEPYFKAEAVSSVNVMMRKPSRAELPPPGDQPTLAFILHHKTGENLHRNMATVLGPLCTHHLKDFYELKGAELVDIPGTKRIHMIRDPVDVIASGLRYHQTRWGAELWGWGHKRLQDPQCFECTTEDHAVIFDSCHFNCTYFELLNRLDDMSATVTEAVSARHTVTSMFRTMQLLGEDPNTLHLSMNLFKTNFAKTSKCVLNFLGLQDRPGLLENLTRRVQEVDDKEHVTHGHFINWHVKSFLRNHPVWGPEFNRVNRLKEQIFARQVARWGCPSTEALSLMRRRDDEQQDEEEEEYDEAED